MVVATVEDVEIGEIGADSRHAGIGWEDELVFGERLIEWAPGKELVLATQDKEETQVFHGSHETNLTLHICEGVFFVVIDGDDTLRGSGVGLVVEVGESDEVFTERDSRLCLEGVGWT